MNNMQDWMDWVKVHFTESTSISSIKHLKTEIQELLDEIDSDDPSPLQDEGIPLLEYADCILCLLSSASLAGFNSEQITKALQNKASNNMYRRSWKSNGDGTYSHVK